MRDFPESVGIKAQKRKAFVRDWIARNQRKLAGGLASGMLVLPLMAQAQAEGFVNVNEIRGIQSIQQLPDGTLRLILNNGQQVIIQDADVIVTADGDILISQAAADMVATLVGVDAGVIGGTEIIAAGAAAGLLAAAAGGGSGAEPEPPVPTLNLAQVESQTFEQVFGAPPPAGATHVFVKLGEGENTFEVAANQDGDGNWTFGFPPEFLDALQGQQVLSFRAEREVLDENDEPTGEFEQIGSGSANVFIDTIPPVIDITEVAGSDNVLNAAEQETGLVVEGTTDAEDGQEVTVLVEDALGSVVVTGTATVENGEWRAVIDAIDLLDDADYTVIAAVEDAAGNKPDLAAQATFTTDFTATIAIDPVDDLTTADSFFDLVIRGDTDGVEQDQMVTVSFGGIPYGPVPVGADGTWEVTIPQADLAALRDEGVESVMVGANVEDLAGNIAGTSESIPATFTPPSLTITSPAEDLTLNAMTVAGGLEIAGTTVPGATVTIGINPAPPPPVADGDGNWSVTILADDLPADGVYTITASAELNGIAVAPDATVGLIIDTVAPTVTIDPFDFGPVLNSTERDDGVSITGTVSDAGTPDLSDIVMVLTVDGVSVPVTISTDGTPTATWTANVPTGLLGDLDDDAEIEVSVTATDPAQNTSDPVTESFDTDFTAEIFVDDDLSITTINQFIGFEVTGTTNGVEDGRTVTVTFEGEDYTGTVDWDTWSVPIPADVIADLDDETEFSFTAAVSDVAGNSDSASSSVSTDFSQPALAITSPVDGSFINADAANEELEVTGIALPGESVTVTLEGGATRTFPEVPVGSVWSVTFDPDDLPDADGPVVITAESEIEGTPVTITVTVTLDTEPPDAPTIALAEDTGTVAGETSNGQVDVSGLEPGGRAEYSLDGGTEWIPFEGDSFTLEDDGAYTVTVRQFDAANNGSPNSNEISFTLDTEAPATPTIALAEDTGTVAGETSNGQVDVDGLEADSIREYSLDGGTSWTGFTGDSFTLTGDGAKNVTVRQTDGAGNVSDTSDPLEFTLDTEAPATPTIALADDTGTVAGETSNGQVDVDGLEADSIREYSLDGGTSWTEFTGDSFTLTGDDDYSVTVRQTDGAGNVSDTSDPLEFTLDTTPPEVTITSLAGIAAGDSLTAGELFDSEGAQLSNIIVTGTALGAPDGATVSLVLGGSTALVLLPPPTVTGEEWTAEIPSQSLRDTFGDQGPAEIEARITDGAGNTGVGTLDFTMDVVVPAITITDPEDGFVIGIDEFENGVTIAGTTTDVPAGQEVTITFKDSPDDDEGFEATAEVQPDGSWSLLIPPETVQGGADEVDFILTASVSDGVFPAPVTDSIDISTDIPPQVTINLGEDGALIIADVAENGLTISGTTRGVQEGQRVILQIDEGDGDGPSDIFEEFEDNPTVQADGTWSVFIPDHDLDGVEPGMALTFLADVSNESGRAADTASTTVVAYEASVSFLEASGTGPGGELLFDLRVDPDRVEGDVLNVITMSVEFDPAVVQIAAAQFSAPVAIDPTAVIPNTFAVSPFFGIGAANTEGFFTFNGLTSDGIDNFPTTPIARIAFTQVTVDEVAEIILARQDDSVLASSDRFLSEPDPEAFAATPGPVSYFWGTDDDDVIEASNWDSFIRGRGGDDQIDVSAPGVNTIIFEPTFALNGEDEITGFTIGGALPDRIGIAFNDDFAQSDLRGTGEFFQIIEAGDSISANTGFVVFTTDFTGVDDSVVAEEISDVGLGEDESIFALVGDEEGYSLIRLFRDGAADPVFEELAFFEGGSVFDLADFSSANILGFEQFTT
ncbi:MAG: hypothetical protein JJU42_12765 [Rhodobacteraceae bacterium]|nr:hypothetical protein [Paracoccaceae bacterium]